MNPTIKRQIFSHYSLCSLVLAAIRLKNKRSAERASRSRMLCSLLDYPKLIKPFPYYPVDIAIDNALYGLSRSLKLYAGISPQKRMGAFIEHGLFFGSYIQQDEYYTPGSHIFTFSDTREKWLKKGGIAKRIAKIGPMIHYAPPLYHDVEERREDLKAQLGRVLLFFPIHGDRYITTLPANYELLISQVKARAVGFDTVLVSLYWHDALNPQYITPYINAGFHIVTSGHKFDPYFLSRQRFLIELADSTLSNGNGTHVGYCTHLQKEHSMLSIASEEFSTSRKLENRLRTARSIENDRTQLEETKEVETAFTHLPKGITPEHLQIVEKYWGTSHVRNREEMRELILSTQVK